jgi:hypothetical protein
VEKMKAFKGIIMIAMIMAVFTLLMVPMEESLFPSWIGTDFLQFLLVLLCGICAIVLMR